MSSEKSRWWDAMFVVALCAPMALVLSLPVFPSQDGPIHLYYVDVLRALLSHSNQYGGYFVVRTLVTPYALQYYSLLALQTVVSAVMSEKILICVYIGLFGWSFKYLVESVAEYSGAWPLVAIPFCLNNLIYLGLLNYCLGVALTLCLAGYWVRSRSRLGRKQILTFGFGVFLLLLTHPIPVAVLLLFMGLTLFMELARERALRPLLPGLRAHGREIAVMIGTAAAAGIWIAGFLGAPSKPEPHPATAAGLQAWIVTAITQLKLWPIAPITSGAYRAGLMALLLAAIGALFLGAARRWRVLVSSVVPALCLTSLSCFVLYLFLPEWLSGSNYFRERFPIFFVLFLAAAAAGASGSVRWSYVPGVVALMALACTLGLQRQRTSEITANLSPMLAASLEKPLAAGVLLHERNPQDLPDPDLAFDPYGWAGAHFFRQSHAILLNTPWLDLRFYMFRPARPGPWDYLNPAMEADYLSSQAGCWIPPLDIAVRVGREVPSGKIDSLIRAHNLSLTARAGERLAVYTRREGMAGGCDTGPKVVQ